MGLYLLWKSPGLSSGDSLANFKRELGLPGKSREGIGHTGTLDPFASGILLVGTEEATKLLAPLNGLDKTYEATALLGVTSDTLDPEGALTAGGDLSVSEATLEAFLKARPVDFSQIPPAFSAIQVDGQRSYDLARKGKAVELKARPAKLLSARHLGLEKGEFRGHPVLRWRFEVRVGSGTYIRCLARDWGLELTGAAGMLESLVRTAVGPFRMPEPQGHLALKVDGLHGLFAMVPADEAEVGALRNGGRWREKPTEIPGLVVGPTGEVLAWVEAPFGKLGRIFRTDPFG